MAEVPSGISKSIQIITRGLFRPKQPEAVNPVISGIENSILLTKLNRQRNVDYEMWAQTQSQFERYLNQPGNIVPAILGRRCIDGRYPKDGQSQGMIARPGGDYGYALVLAAVTDPDSFFHKTFNTPVLTPENCFDMVFNAVTAEGKPFYMHTDHHDDGTNIGCGHAAAPIKHREYYRLFEEGRPELLLQKVREQSSNEGLEVNELHLENLHGSHEEKAVVIVTGTNKTIRSQNESGEMYFVYDITRDYEYMVKRLLPVLSENLHLQGEGRERFISDFLYLSSAQIENSLHILAGEKPRFLVNPDKRKPSLKLLPVGAKINLRDRYYGGQAISYRNAA